MMIEIDIYFHLIHFRRSIFKYLMKLKRKRLEKVREPRKRKSSLMICILVDNDP